MAPSNPPRKILWFMIFIYVGVIYATLPLVSRWRKSLVESYGYDVFDHIYWIFGLIFLGMLIYLFKNFRGKPLIKALASLGIIILLYAYYLTDMKYAIERIHFLQYGLLGALLFIGLLRHLSRFPALVCGLCFAYLIGLGDEGVQYLLPGRVGEIRDSIINLFSALLGIMLVLSVSDSRSSGKITPRETKWILKFCIGCLVFTNIFILGVHGFGYKHQTKNPGVIYSSLSLKELQAINSNALTHQKHLDYYMDEAKRHLFQREFYCSNDYLGADGKMYKKWDHCLFEHQVLEYFYPQFLTENAQAEVYPFLKEYDEEVAQMVKENKVGWDSSWYQGMLWALSETKLMESRVKSTMIISYKLKDLLFYSLLLLGALGWWHSRYPKPNVD